MVHGVSAMLRHLRPKPTMECDNEGRICRGVSNLSSVRQGRIANVDLREPGLQFGQPRHLIAVNSGRIGEVTPAKLVRFVLEVGLNQGNLLRIRRIFHSHRLPPAIIKPLKHMDRLLKIERHHLRAACCDPGLAGAACRCPENKSDQQDGSRTHHRYAGGEKDERCAWRWDASCFH